MKRKISMFLLGLAIGLCFANVGYRLYHVYKNYTLDELIAHQRHR
jgi:hypothetical protein